MANSTPPSPSLPHRAFLAFVDAIHAKDHAAIMACYDDSADVSAQMLPYSLAYPRMDKSAHSDFIKTILASMKYMRLTVYEVIEAGSALTVHGSTKGKSVSGTPFANEYIFIVHFAAAPLTTGSLPKIKSLKEFVDSAAVMRFFAEDRAANEMLESAN